MTLKGQIATDAALVFCNPNDFAESVTYYPHRHYGEEERQPRTFDAVVIRQQLTTFGEAGDVVTEVWEIHVPNSQTVGIASDEIDLGGDQIGLPPRVGESAQRKSIVRMNDNDEGMLVLECR